MNFQKNFELLYRIKGKLKEINLSLDTNHRAFLWGAVSIVPRFYCPAFPNRKIILIAILDLLLEFAGFTYFLAGFTQVLAGFTQHLKKYFFLLRPAISDLILEIAGG